MSLDRSTAILELGRRLVVELNTKDDVLASWMSHYIAERIYAAENDPPETREVSQRACMDAIAALWRHRRDMPSHLQPFAEPEPLLRTIAALNANSAAHYYHRDALRDAALAVASAEAKQWVDLALGIDYAARVLIQYALSAAVGEGLSPAKQKIDLMQAADIDAELERGVYSFVEEFRAIAAPDSNQSRALAKDRAKQLEVFSALALDLAAMLRSSSDTNSSEEQEG